MGFLSSLFGFDDAKPAQSQVVQAAKIPEELKPYVTEIMESAQTQFKDNMARGYVPYTGKTTADLTPEEVQSMERISGLAGVVDPYIGEAEDIYRTGAREFTGEEAQKLMSPYQQAVTDIEKRKAQENFEANVMPTFEARAISQGGGPGGLGTRAGIEAAELQKGQAQLLADIQARGSEKAYQDAKGVFADQLTRERQLAGDLGRTGSALFQSGLAEAGALEGVGATKRGIAQNLLDESLYKFKEEEAYPQSELAKYSGTIYGNPVLGTPSFTRTTSESPYQPSTGQNLLGLGLTGLNIYGMGGGFGAPTPGKFSPANIYSPQPVRRVASGGKVGGGLSDLPVVRKATGDVGTPNYSNIHMSEFDFEDADMKNITSNLFPSASKNLENVTMEDITRNRPDLNVQNVKLIEQDRTYLQKDLVRKSNDELDALHKAYFAGKRSNIKDNPMARGAIIQKLIGVIAGSPKGALGGFLEGAPDALKGISDLDMKLAAKEAELVDLEFKTKIEKLKERKKEKLNFINRDADMSRLYDQLPGKAKEAFLKEFSTIETLNLKRAEIDQKIKAALAKAAMDGKKFKQRLEEFALKKDKLGVDQAKIPQLVRDLMYVDPEAAITSLVKADFTQLEIEKVFQRVISKGAGTSGVATVLSTGKNVPPTGLSLKDLQKTVQAIQSQP